MERLRLKSKCKTKECPLTRSGVAEDIANGCFGREVPVVLLHERTHARVMGWLHVLVDKHKALLKPGK